MFIVERILFISLMCLFVCCKFFWDRYCILEIINVCVGNMSIRIYDLIIEVMLSCW